MIQANMSGTILYSLNWIGNKSASQTISASLANEITKLNEKYRITNNLTSIHNGKCTKSKMSMQNFYKNCSQKKMHDNKKIMVLAERQSACSHRNRLLITPKTVLASWCFTYMHNKICWKSHKLHFRVKESIFRWKSWGK